MDFKVEFVLPDGGRDPELGELLVDGFTAAGCDAVAHQDLAAGEADVTVWLSADDAATASQSAIAMLRSIEAAEPLVPTAVHVAAVGASAPEAA